MKILLSSRRNVDFSNYTSKVALDALYKKDRRLYNKVLYGLATSDDMVDIICVFLAPEIPDEIFDTLLDRYVYNSDTYISNVLINIAKYKKTPPEILDNLAHDERFGFSAPVTIADNPNTSSETLDYLATNESSRVRYGVAYNDNTSQETLHALLNDPDVSTRMAAEWVLSHKFGEKF
jgi:hypothetical protein